MHIECYARKADAKGRSVAFVLDEAERVPQACQHVQNPKPPELVYGVSVDQLRRLHDDRADEARAVVAGGRSRRIRSDQHTLLTVVVSHPALTDAVQHDAALAAEVAAWERSVVTWLRSQWGDDVVTVVRHSDEGHPHFHAYILPSDDAMRAKRLHPGAAAKEVVKAQQAAAGCDAKAANTAGDKAYVAAMRALQDDYYRAVGIPAGQARLGPGRRRLTRAEWHAEKSAAKAAAEAIHASEKMLESAEKAKADANVIIEVATQRRNAADALQAKAETACARATTMISTAKETTRRASIAAADADKRRDAAERHASRLRAEVQGIVAKARGEAQRLVSHATKKADLAHSRAKNIGAWFGSWLYGLRGVAPEAVAQDVAARVRAEERGKAAVVIAIAQNEAVQAGEALRHMEDRLASVSASAATLSRQRDELARRLDQIKPTRKAETEPAFALMMKR